VLFLERDVPWYAPHRDMPSPPGAATHLYRSLDELRARHEGAVRDADLVVVGSYVPEGISVGEWVVRTACGVTAFYDIDTPVTLAKLDGGDVEYISRELIPRYHLYLSFTGGPTLERLRIEFGAMMPRPLYCSVDAAAYIPHDTSLEWELGYLGTYSADRQPLLTELMLRPAGVLPGARFVVAGAQYPDSVAWPHNVARIEHLPPRRHPAFYSAQRYTLNITRADMVRAGWSPSVRLFEAAACGTPIITDAWDGLDDFFEPGRDILVARSGADTLEYLLDLSERTRRAVGESGRARVLARHTAAHRALELESFVGQAISAGA